MGFLNSIFGSTPKVPDFKPVDLAQSQTKALAENQAALPAAEALTTTANAFSQDQIAKMLEKYAPGFGANSSQIGKNISSELQGKLPTDVLNTIQQSGAAKALQGGFGGSQFGWNLTAKDLGLTSLQLMQQGQSAAESWTALVDRMFAPGQMDVSSMFITPQLQFAADQSNNQGEWNAQWLKNQVKAQPNPIAAGLVGLGMKGLQAAALGYGAYAGAKEGAKNAADAAAAAADGAEG